MRIFILITISLIHSFLIAQTNVNGNMSGTWTVAGSPYILTGSVTVPVGQTLTINPGVEVQFPTSSDIVVNGTLMANGTALDSIRFKGVNASASIHGGKLHFTPQSSNSEVRFAVFEKMGDTAPQGLDAGILFQTSSATVEHCRLYDAELFGIRVEGAYSPVLRYNLVQQCGQYGFYHITQGGAPVLEHNTFSGHTQSDIFVNPANVSAYIGNIAPHIMVNATLTTSASWPKGALAGGAKYLLAGSLSINPGAVLTIAPGVEVQFPTSSDIVVNGTLMANGTALDSIRFKGVNASASIHGGKLHFTSQSSNSEVRFAVFEKMGDSNNSGLHGVLLFQTSSATVEHCRLYDAEIFGIRVEGAYSPVLRYNLVQQCGQYGFYHITQGGAPVLEHNTFSGHTQSDIFVNPANVSAYIGNIAPHIKVTGTLSITGRWSKEALVGGAKYLLSGNLTISHDAALTIDSGVEAWFGVSDDIVVNGTLIVNGTALDSVRFKGINVNPSTKGGAIVFTASSANSLVKYGVFENMGDFSSIYDAVIHVQTDNVTLDKCRVSGSELYGVRVISGSPTIKHLKLDGNISTAIRIQSGQAQFSNCDITGFATGVSVTGGSPKFVECTIQNNTIWGVQNTGQGIVDARTCYWGAETGPLNFTQNPTGQGNQVSNRVWFNPWVRKQLKSLTIGAVNLDTLGQNIPGYYLLNIPDSLDDVTIRIQLYSDNNTGINELYAEKDKFPERGKALYRASEAMTTNREMLLFGIPSGIHYVAIYPQGSGLQHLQLFLEILDYQIFTANPTKGGNIGPVTIKLNGAQFEPNMFVRLEDNGNVLVTAESMEYINGGQVFATFNLSDKQVGNYDLVIEKSNGDTAHWGQQFQVVYGEIIPGSGEGINPIGCSPENVEETSFLFIRIESPVAGRRGYPILLTIHYQNQGTVDIPLLRRILSSQRGEALSFDLETINQGVPTLLLELKEPDGPSDILRAGAGGSIQVYAIVANGTNEFKLLK